MPDRNDPAIDPKTATIYEIRLEGHLDAQWADWFEGLDVTLKEDGVTQLTGPVADQATLHGLFKKVRDLGMSLLSVYRVQPKTEKQSDPRRRDE